MEIFEGGKAPFPISGHGSFDLTTGVRAFEPKEYFVFEVPQSPYGVFGLYYLQMGKQKRPLPPPVHAPLIIKNIITIQMDKRMQIHMARDHQEEGWARYYSLYVLLTHFPLSDFPTPTEGTDRSLTEFRSRVRLP